MMRHLFQVAAILILAGVCRAQVDGSITLSDVACQGMPLNLLCPLGFYIQVSGGLHGRLDFTSCASGAEGSTQRTCIASEDIEDRVREVCDGRNMCHFETEGLPTGNCSLVSTYVSIRFQCLWPSTKMVACQDRYLRMSCPSDKVIKVTNVQLGRTLDSVCSNTSSQMNTTCEPREALSFAQELCDGTDSCSILVADHVAKDCSGQGQLKLSYNFSCIGCENANNNDTYCDKLALKGACQADKSWMTINCLKSCLRCDATSLCSNTKGDATCTMRAAQGDCSNPVVSDYCEKTCTKCRNSQPLSTIVPPMLTVTTQPPRCINVADESLCHNSAILGECDTGDSIVMMQKCYRSCSGCNATECEDLLEECPTLASKGECGVANNTHKCPVSCNGTCDLADLNPNRSMECVNNYHDENSCDFWAMTGECDTNSYWMRKHCYKSCVKCHMPNICDNNMDHKKCDKGAANNKCSDRDFAHQCPRSCMRCPKVNETSTSLTRCVNAHSSDADCSYWALRGECDVNPDWMTLNCYKACRACATDNSSACKNAKDDSDCEFWQSLGECESNAKWMSIYCYKTCSYCALPDCANRRGDLKCRHWASIGECEMNPEWMGINCQAACRKCDEHLNETAICVALWNATHGNDSFDNMTTTSAPVQMTTTSMDMFSNMTECEMVVTEGNCSIEEFALLCPEECYNLTCNDTGLIYKHPVLRYYDVPELNYGTSACDGDIWIVCPNSYSINVTSADFFAEDKEYCLKQETERRMQKEWWVVEQENKAKNKKKANSPVEVNTPCEDPGVLEQLIAECNGKSWCHFNLSESNYTHVCPDETSRFLNVSFTCKEEVFTGVACKGVFMNMRCWSHQSIQVHKAMYGRQDEETCLAADGSSLENNRTCNNQHATALIKELCNYNQTCAVQTSSILLGDPCPGTSKYLTVDFSCIECRNSYHSEFHCDYWAQIGECEKNPSWMMAYCRRSCTRCHVVDTCNNTHHNTFDCNYWASIGECKRNPDWMIDRCQRSCNRCPDDFEVPTPTPWPTRPPFPNASREDSYDSFYMEVYLTKRWHKDYLDSKYEKSKRLYSVVNETLWSFYSDAYPSTFENLTHYYLRKSTITPWVIVGYFITFTEDVTESEAVDIECAILDRDNGTLFIDNETMIVTLNHTKIQCERRKGYCHFGAPWLRKGDGTFYCKCPGEWAGDKCNELPLWGKVVLGVIGFILVIIIIVLVVLHIWKKRRNRKEDKKELVEKVKDDTIQKDGNLNLKGVAEIEIEEDINVQCPVTPDLLHNRKRLPIPRLPLPRIPDEDKQTLRLDENEEHGTTYL